MNLRALLGFAILLATLAPESNAQEQLPADLQRWMGPQEWKHDTDGPVLSLGEEGEFDDTHMFAPAVVKLEGEMPRYLLWYSGSSGSAHDVAPKPVADERVFRLGLATSDDGREFRKSPSNPVLEIPEDHRSVLTASVLRDTSGAPIREEGKLRMWFTSAAFRGENRTHRIQHTTSVDGRQWSTPSEPLLESAYAPSVLKTDKGYEMWFTDVSKFPWKIRHALSKDGFKWEVTPGTAIELSQSWEQRIVTYPHVLQIDGVYLMWYGSYNSDNRQTTALGFAVSRDGTTWHKHPDNPVLEPDPSRPWESHYVTSQSVIRDEDGRFRIWYASRKAPPFTNLYFALNTAVWEGPAPATGSSP